MKLLRDQSVRFIWQFIVLHVLTYAAFGILFILISNYFNYAQNESVFRQMAKPPNVASLRLSIPTQLLLGTVLALAVFPFRSIVTQRPYGWLKLFWLLFVLLSCSTVVAGPGSLGGYVYDFYPYRVWIAVPEIAFQLMAFSFLLYRWQNRKQRRGGA